MAIRHATLEFHEDAIVLTDLPESTGTRIYPQRPVAVDASDWADVLLVVPGQPIRVRLGDGRLVLLT
jgi:hypothetical protein